MTEEQNSKLFVWEFGILNLGFVSDFDIRICGLAIILFGSGYAGLGI
jgi:hypothetical protein